MEPENMLTTRGKISRLNLVRKLENVMIGANRLCELQQCKRQVNTAFYSPFGHRYCVFGETLFLSLWRPWPCSFCGKTADAHFSSNQLIREELSQSNMGCDNLANNYIQLLLKYLWDPS